MVSRRPGSYSGCLPAGAPQHFSGLPHDPDAIADTWETLLRVLQKADATATKGKIRWAETIAPHLEPDRNQSASFRYFRRGLLAAPAR
ncbi:hypothetical protein [Hymenobacter cellulosilyticus]|uniref:Uncharacterized protein n=1 Tax=Hymenobacter cellulosilyticus TaxID=2932248 RepID=A0A8T9Q593_9BACT|nr:hypothetical protein [Hymenobacter cellulosilyticus]UOQ72687.1 hypothetical protein MUN79_01445 [Hymenobacter cellulosilyticus]